MLRVVLVATALLTGACYIETWAGAEKTTLAGDSGRGYVAGLSFGTVWGGPAILGAGLATTTHRGGGVDTISDAGIQGRADVQFGRLAAVATGNYSWIGTQKQNGMSSSQVGIGRGGSLGLGFVVPAPAYQQGILSISATYERWNDLALGADSATAVGGEVRFRWFWSSLRALGSKGVEISNRKTGGLGEALENHKTTTDTPISTPAPTCDVVETCSYGAFGRTCSTSRSCH